jgi:hypothetical protein
MIREAIKIELLPNTMIREDGLRLNGALKPLIHTLRGRRKSTARPHPAARPCLSFPGSLGLCQVLSSYRSSAISPTPHQHTSCRPTTSKPPSHTSAVHPAAA